RIGNQILQQAAQKPPVGADGERARNEDEPQALLRRNRVEFALELTEQLVDPEARPLRLHRARIEAGNVQEGGEDLLDSIEGRIDVPGKRRIADFAVALREGGYIEACGIERLQDVVRRGCEKAGLGDVGFVR